MKRLNFKSEQELLEWLQENKPGYEYSIDQNNTIQKRKLKARVKGEKKRLGESFRQDRRSKEVLWNVFQYVGIVLIGIVFILLILVIGK